LPDPVHPGLVADSHEVVGLPSASILAALRRRGSERRPVARTVAVLADPVFDAQDERLGAPGRQGRSPAGAGARAVAGVGEGEAISRLPLTRREARALPAAAAPPPAPAAPPFAARPAPPAPPPPPR